VKMERLFPNRAQVPTNSYQFPARLWFRALQFVRRGQAAA